MRADFKLTHYRAFEIRLGTRELHDRFVIPSKGNADFIGTSLSGVGKGVAVMGSLSDEVTTQVRKLYERHWKEAEPLPSTTINEGEESADRDTAS